MQNPKFSDKQITLALHQCEGSTFSTSIYRQLGVSE